MRPHSRTTFSLQLSVTNACNLSCTHCYREETKAFPNEFTTAEIAQLFEDYAGFCARIGYRPSVTLGGGEPLLRQDLGLIIRMAKTAGIGVRIISNGVLSARQAVYLKEWGANIVQVSLDGATAETHERVRGKGTFARTLEGVRHLLDAGIFVNAKVTLIKGLNYHEVPEFFDLCNRERIPVLTFGRLIPIGAGARLSVPNPAEYQALCDLIATEGRKSTFTRVEFREPTYDRSFLGTKGHFQSSEGFSHLAVDSDGTVFISRRLPIVIGNLREKSFDDLYHHPAMIDLREGALKGKCSTCDLAATCGGGSRASAYGKTGDYLAEDPDCWYEPLRSLAAHEA